MQQWIRGFNPKDINTKDLKIPISESPPPRLSPRQSIAEMTSPRTKSKKPSINNFRSFTSVKNSEPRVSVSLNFGHQMPKDLRELETPKLGLPRINQPSGMLDLPEIAVGA